MTQDLETRLADLERRVAQLEAPRAATRASSTPTPKLKPSAREFLLDRAPKTDLDKTLAAGYHIEIICGAESFDFDGIEGFYAEAKEAAPANRRDPPYQNVKKGYFREVGKRAGGMKARNRWALTNLGIARVESGFQKK
jgi:hypothetical protein